MPSARRPSLRAHLKPRHKLWLNWDGAFLMGPRYLRFLDAVDRTGTIRAAGREVGWSYRTCLNRIREMERVLGAKVLATSRGGPSGGGSAKLTVEARRLDADVVLSHAPEAERVLVDSGYFVRRRLVMHNDFLVVGPPADPAGLRGMSDAVAAFRRLAERPVVFVSRGDQSGTHQREQALWKRARLSVPPFGGSYVESGQGMGATLQLADEKHGYTLTDRATYLAWRDKLQLVPLVEGDPLLYNVYHVLELNPKNAPRINVAGGRAFAEFLVSPGTQALIGAFDRARFGRSLFVPDADKPDSW